MVRDSDGALRYPVASREVGDVGIGVSTRGAEVWDYGAASPGGPSLPPELDTPENRRAAAVRVLEAFGPPDGALGAVGGKVPARRLATVYIDSWTQGQPGSAAVRVVLAEPLLAGGSVQIGMLTGARPVPYGRCCGESRLHHGPRLPSAGPIAAPLPLPPGGCRPCWLWLTWHDTAAGYSGSWTAPVSPPFAPWPRPSYDVATIDVPDMGLWTPPATAPLPALLRDGFEGGGLGAWIVTQGRGAGR